MMIARLEEVVWDLTDEGVLFEGRAGASCPIIVLHSASRAGGCDVSLPPIAATRDFRFYGLAVLQSLDTSAPPPSPVEFDGL